MKRQDKYPETRTFHYYNANPKNRFTTDCVIRAIATALEQDYNQTVMELAQMQCETGYDDGDNNTDPIDILYRAFYGYDEDNWHTESHGNKEYGAFNPNRDYFYYNGYGNLVSTNYKDYSAHLDVWLIEEMCDYRDDLDAIINDDVLAGLFDELGDCEE